MTIIIIIIFLLLSICDFLHFFLFLCRQEFTCTSHPSVSVASGLGVSLGQFKDNTLKIMKTYKLFRQSVLEVSFFPDSKTAQLKQSLYRPITGPECSRRLRLLDFDTVGK